MKKAPTLVRVLNADALVARLQCASGHELQASQTPFRFIRVQNADEYAARMAPGSYGITGNECLHLEAAAMKHLIIISVFLCMWLAANGQKIDFSSDTARAEDYLLPAKDYEHLFLKRHGCLEPLPIFPGNLNAFLLKNVKMPDSILDCYGRVVVGFTVRKDGSLSDLQILRNTANCAELGWEVLRVFRAMPKWTPGTREGRPVDMEMFLPVTIKPD